VSKPIRVVVVDDHPLYRDGVIRTLREDVGIEVLGEGGSADEAFALCRDLRPDIALLDVSMPGGGMTALRNLTAAGLGVRAVMLTVSESDGDVIAALADGAKGYVLKGVEGRELVAILKRVAAGESHVAPALAANLLVNMKSALDHRGRTEPGPLLTEREEGILRLVSLGRSNKEIGRSLDLQEKTVKHYMTGILQKLNVRNRVEAAVMARERMGIGKEE
jgi:two-component system, NarL family, nitrate/nitrite response regulator NarL